MTIENSQVRGPEMERECLNTLPASGPHFRLQRAAAVVESQ
jgi:hypothetical protein